MEERRRAGDHRPPGGHRGRRELRRPGCAALRQITGFERLQANAALRAEISRLRADPKYLEALARKRLGLVKHDEMVYRFPDADEP